MRLRVCILVAVLLGSGVWLRADTVILTNGDRIEGQILQQSPDEIAIRRLSDDGRIRFVQKIARAQIHAIEEGPVPDLTPRAQSRPGQPVDLPADAPLAASRPVRVKARTKVSTLDPADRQGLLKVAIDKWKKREYSSAGFNLSRLINNLNEADQAALSAQVEKTLDMSLGDFAAEAHFRAAVDVSQQRAGSLQYVTSYEKPYLIPRLVDAYERALNEEVAVPGRIALPRSLRLHGPAGEHRLAEVPPTASDPAATRPAGFGIPEACRSPRTVAAWVDRPDDFDLPRSEARAFARQVILAVKLLSEIARLDPEAQTNRDRSEELTQTRRKLYALYRVAIARAGGALTPEEREAQQASIDEQQERIRRIVELNQKRQQEMMERAIEAAKERGALPKDLAVPTSAPALPPARLPDPVDADDITAADQILRGRKPELGRER